MNSQISNYFLLNTGVCANNEMIPPCTQIYEHSNEQLVNSQTNLHLQVRGKLQSAITT